MTSALGSNIVVALSGQSHVLEWELRPLKAICDCSEHHVHQWTNRPTMTEVSCVDSAQLL